MPTGKKLDGRERHRAPARPPRPPGGRAARRSRMRSPVAWGLALAALAALAWFAASRVGWPGSASRSDPAVAMRPDDARQTALAQGRAGRHLASLPYFRRVASALPGSWADRFNYGSALSNAAQEGRMHLGKEEPAIRSSVERVGMAKHSLEEMRTAETLTDLDADRALIAFERARALHTWGFPLDALEAFAQARERAPGRADIAAAAAAVESLAASGGRERR